MSAPQPLRPPIAATKPCARCEKPFAPTRKQRVCPECQQTNKRRHNAIFSANRSDIVFLKERVLELEKTVDAICRNLLHCRVGTAKERPNAGK